MSWHWKTGEEAFRSSGGEDVLPPVSIERHRAGGWRWPGRGRHLRCSAGVGLRDGQPERYLMRVNQGHCRRFYLFLFPCDVGGGGWGGAPWASRAPGAPGRSLTYR
ncbi:unnamed protein product [Ectocarpus sp. CCAP 1310/34]|nr:unnamed protein product [Ectocarpus sp. CCAP 1310/34]